MIWRPIVVGVIAVVSLSAAVVTLSLRMSPKPEQPLVTNTHQRPLTQLHTLTMMTPQAGWAVNGRQLLHTVDGGQHWTSVTPIDLPVIITSSTVHNTVWQFVNGQTAWLIGRAGVGDTIRLAYTQDNGRHWSEQTVRLPGLTSGTDLTAVDFLNDHQGWIMGSGFGVIGSTTIWTTTNGGQTWQRVYGTPLAGGNLVFQTPTLGWMTIATPGNDGPQFKLETTTTGGRAWTAVPLPSIGWIEPARSPTFRGPAGLLPVVSTTGFLAVLRTANAGHQWVASRKFPLAVNQNWLPTIQSEGGSLAWAVAKGHLWRSTNGGRTWTLRSTAPFLQTASGLDFLNPKVGWIWQQTKDGRAQIWRTTSGGQRWTAVTPTLTASGGRAKGA